MKEKQVQKQEIKAHTGDTYVCLYLHQEVLHIYVHRYIQICPHSIEVYNVYLRKEMMVERVEYCWLIFSEGVVQGGGFMGIPGGNRPHR